MSHNLSSQAGLGMPTGGLASRRGGQNIKPLSFDTIKNQTGSKDNGVPTPRTSRSHYLSVLRTAPKTAAATSNFPPSPGNSSMSMSQQMHSRNISSSMQSGSNGYNGPKTSLPRLSTTPQQAQGTQQPYMMNLGQQYTPDQILAPPELYLDDSAQEQMDPTLYAQIVATNQYLAQQQQQLQLQLMQVQAAAQQFQGMNLGGQASLQQQLALQNLYQRQAQLQNMQQSMVSSLQQQHQQTQLQQLQAQQQQAQFQLQMQQQQQQQQQQQKQQIYTCIDPATGEQLYYMEHPNTGQQLSPANNMYMDQPATPQHMSFQQSTGTPRVQVSPPPMDNERFIYRSNSPPKKSELTAEPTPLPPPSANAFRRGHKKMGSSVNAKGLSVLTDDATAKPFGPKSAAMPLSPLPMGYGPGQGRAGEHPVRQPRGPPSIDELRLKPTTLYDGSKNFVARTRRTALNSLVKAGLERRKGTGSTSTGSGSPISETGDSKSPTKDNDNESDSGRSGSGSLSGDAEVSVASSRTSTSGSWGAIGSDRPSSRSKARRSVDSLSSTASENESGSFASVFKNAAQRPGSKPATPDGQRKAPMLVLTSVEKRKVCTAAP